MAEGKEYFPSKEREENEDFRNREMQKRDERTNALRPKKEKVKNRWRDDGYGEEGRFGRESNRRENSFENRRGDRWENNREMRREPRELQFREERENRFERDGERRGFHRDSREDWRGNRSGDSRDFDRRDNAFDNRRRDNRFDDRRGNQQNAPFREHRNVEDKNRFNSGEINLASRRSHGKGFKKPTFKK